MIGFITHLIFLSQVLKINFYKRVVRFIHILLKQKFKKVMRIQYKKIKVEFRFIIKPKLNFTSFSGILNEKSAARSMSKESLQSSSPKSLQKLLNINGIYMQQNSPENPFGPNYKELPMDTKITYKWSMAKQFIKLTPEDTFHKEIEQQRFLGTLILGFVGGYFLAEIPRMIYSKIKNRAAKRGWAVVFSTCAFSSVGYLKAHQRYFDQVPRRFLSKYLPEAIQNGFQDYQISKSDK